MNDWTPGPWPVSQSGDGKRWIVGKGLVEGPNGYEVAEVYADDAPYSETRANAYLIASAPCLLEALEGVIAAMGNFTAPESHPSHQAWASARAAIARARGESA